MHNQNWDDLRYILAVGQAGSLNGAARALGVNHATVLRRVRAFEERWQRQIFQKSQSGYELDPSIQDILDVIQDMENSAAKTQRILASKATEISGLVRLTSTDSLSQIVLPEVIGDLQAQHPGIQIELYATNQHMNMFSPDADLALRPALYAPDDLRARACGNMVFEIYAAPQYWEENADKSFEEMNWLGVTAPLSKSPVGLWMDEALPANAITFRADSFLVLRDLAAAGHGVCFLPRFIAKDRDGLVVNPRLDMTLQTSLWIVGHEDMERNPHIKTCARFLADALRERVF